MAAKYAKLTLFLPSTGWKTSPVAGVRMGDGGLFSFGQVGFTGKFSINFPGIDHTCLTDGALNPVETDTAAWISWIQANGTHFQVESKAHAALSSFLSVRNNDRDSRKNLTKKTTRT